ncbi:hypothetical protein ACFL96_06625, partial [Thermoproteota archaeon]
MKAKKVKAKPGETYYTKPRKILLPKEECDKVFKEIKKIYKSIFNSNKNIAKIIIFGSAAKKRFGRYVEPYKGRQKSDVDTII